MHDKCHYFSLKITKIKFGQFSLIWTNCLGRTEPFEMVAPDLPEESAPKIIIPLHSMTFIDGQPMVLRCQIKATPSAAVEWTKDDVNVEEWVINKDVTTQVWNRT